MASIVLFYLTLYLTFTSGFSKTTDTEPPPPETTVNTTNEETLPPIFVLNLDRSKTRWKNTMEQMDQAGLKVNRLPAVDGRAVSKEILYNETTAIARLLQPRGVLGCYMSHRKFWQLVVDRKYESAIVFEDDIVLVDDFKKKLLENMRSIEGEEFDVLLLGAIGRVHPEGKDNFGTLFFSSYMGGSRPFIKITDHFYQPQKPAGTHAYLVTYSGAQKLLTLCPKATFHVDLDAWRHRQLVIRMFTPMLVFQTFAPTSLTGSGVEEVIDGPNQLNLDHTQTADAVSRRSLRTLIRDSATGYKKQIKLWARDSYTLQPWSHVLDEPMLQIVAPNGFLLTTLRHVIFVCSGTLSTVLLHQMGYYRFILFYFALYLTKLLI